MASPFLYLPGDRLSGAELTAACLDGHLVAVGDAYMPADAVETAELRAGSLAPILRDTLAATHLTAAWIHGALPDPPARHTVQRAVARRLHHVLGARLVYRDVAVPDDDLDALGGVRVTTVGRTVADLARVADVAHDAALAAMAGALPDAVESGLHWLDTHQGYPHSRRGFAVLTGLRTT